MLRGMKIALPPHPPRPLGYGVHTSHKTQSSQQLIAPQPPILGEQENKILSKSPRIGDLEGLDKSKRRQLDLCVHGSFLRGIEGIYSLLKLKGVQRDFEKCGEAALFKISLGFKPAQSAVILRNIQIIELNYLQDKIFVFDFISSKNLCKKRLSMLIGRIFAVKLIEFMNESQDFMSDHW